MVDHLSSGSRDASWSLIQRILFRFSFCYIVLYFAPRFLQFMPGTGLLVNWISYWLNLLVYQLAGVTTPPETTGAGDTFGAYIVELIVLILSLAISIIWSIFDRQQAYYVRLYSWLRVLARYTLAYVLLSYAFAKVIPTQFIPLQNAQLTETYGESSPMGLLWKFMGFSMAYTIFAGCVELLPAFLLLFRRTALLGSILAFIVTSNIVMLNFCYDVPVKLYSINLLLLSAFLVLPDLSRLYHFFVLNRATQPSDLSEPELNHRTLRKTALICKYVMLVLFLTLTINGSVRRYHRQREVLISPSRYPLTTRGFHWIQEFPYNR
ncbi:hypothetical protein [Granulicella sp. dw_53]|uniref:hypothetical protein n=1 Tax=Granulicella sp. dw_53 TaxID=2719792 RepID=UPI001BD3372F|nr:hypothetical protein [Granulicella sp. dw_53]